MQYLPLVNAKMGTKSVRRRSHGNTLPLTQIPFGMNSFCLQTQSQDSWFYYPEHEYLEGVRLTHMPSPWIDDYATVLMTPQNDVIANTAAAAWSGRRLSDTTEDPDYLAVTLLRSACRFELTPTARAAALRLTFLDERPSYLSFLPTKGSYDYRYDEVTSTLFIATDGGVRDRSVNHTAYIAVQFKPCDVDARGSYTVGEGTTRAFHLALKSRYVEARLGVSYISEQMAVAAIARECADKSFEDIRSEARREWEQKLSRIEIETDDDAQLRTFYSCLYRVFLFPHRAYEIDADGKPVHYSSADGRTYPGVRYTDNGFWDTFRTVYPLFSLIAREEFSEMLDGFVNDYREGGWLPRWMAMGEMGAMPSTLIDGVIAEAATSGVAKRETLECALEGMLKHANVAAPERRFGRQGILDYVKYGYVPRDKYEESVNLTLDFAYGDWCIATVARALGREQLVAEYTARSKSYRNLFDPTTGFMRGRDTEGRMADGFDPTSWGGEYTEAAAWQSSFAVPHDVEGLAALFGGREQLLAKLDALFQTPPRYRVFGYGAEIHEMTEMALLDFGQMAICNQPSFHIPFLFSALGEQEKTDYWVERLARETFSATTDGYPGDEDNGTMSAWYIFATLGMYRLCPGKDEWIPTKRLVRSAKILGKSI